MLGNLLIPDVVLQLGLAGLLGLLLGTERAIRHKVASLRTFSMISIGSCLFTILSVQAAQGAVGSAHDLTRVAAGIVTGIGFVGGGVIFKSQDRIEGVSTASMIWLNAAIGMACGFFQISLAIWAFVVSVFFILLSKTIHEVLGY